MEDFGNVETSNSVSFRLRPNPALKPTEEAFRETNAFARLDMFVISSLDVVNDSSSSVGGLVPNRYAANRFDR